MLSSTVKKLDPELEKRIDALIAEYKNKEGALLPLLTAIQKASKRNYLPHAALIKVAEELDIPLSKLYGVATFYSLLSTEPRGKYVIRVCENAPCHVTGAKEVLEAIKAELGIDVNETTECGTFTLETTSCLGVCGVAPVIMINDEVYGNLTPEKVVEVLRGYRDN